MRFSRNASVPEYAEWMDMQPPTNREELYKRIRKLIRERA